MSLFKKKSDTSGVKSAKELDKEREAKSKHSKKERSKKEKRKIKRTTIQTLPYECFVSNYVMLNKTGVKIGKQTANLYSKTYLVPDINYSSVPIDKQEELQSLYIEMLNGFDELVGKRLKTLNPEDLNADGAMDLLERSAKLDSFITGADKDNKPVQGELAITFADSFSGL